MVVGYWLLVRASTPFWLLVIGRTAIGYRLSAVGKKEPSWFPMVSDCFLVSDG